MKQILVYSDSLSWGIIPDTRQRLAFTERWPGALEGLLGPGYRIIENCLNGRRTVWHDPYKSGRKGIEGLAETIEMHSPLEMVIFMLGTNDFQSMHSNNAWHSAQGSRACIQAIQQAPIEPGMPRPKVLVLAPPSITKPKGTIAAKFMGGESRCPGLAQELEKVCQELDANFFDTSRIIHASAIDGIHLDKAQHLELAQGLAKLIPTL